MSTDYKLEKHISINRLFDGSLEPHGIFETIVEGNNSADRRALTDGRNYLWVLGEKKVEFLKRFGANEAYEMIQTIGKAFNTAVYSEYSLDHAGSDTVGAWDEIGLRDDESFKEASHEIVMNQIADLEQSEPGSYSWAWAYVVKRLVTNNSNLVFPDRMDQISIEVMRQFLDGKISPTGMDDRVLEQIRLAVSHEEELNGA